MIKKTLPMQRTGKPAPGLLDTAIPADSDLSPVTPVRFEFQPKERTVTMRMSESLLKAIKETAERSGLPYQRYIRQVLERAVQSTN